MAVTATPIYPQTPKTTAVKSSGTANTVRVDPPTTSSPCDGPAAGSNGARLDKLGVRATANNAAGIIQIWLKKTSDSKYYLIDEITVAAINVSATVPGQNIVWVPPEGAMFLVSGDLIAFTTSIAEVWTGTWHQKDF